MANLMAGLGWPGMVLVARLGLKHFAPLAKAQQMKL